MDDYGIAAAATTMSETRTAEAVQLSVLKKAMEIGADGTMALVEAATQATPPVNPPHLGNNVDVFA